MRAFICPETGGQKIELTRGLIVIGRNETCDIRINHKSVSGVHCALTFQGNVLIVRDLDSSNGTFVNEQRIRRAGLRDGDYLSIASLLFRASIVNDERRETISIDEDESFELQMGDTRSNLPPGAKTSRSPHVTKVPKNIPGSSDMIDFVT